MCMQVFGPECCPLHSLRGSRVGTRDRPGTGAHCAGPAARKSTFWGRNCPMPFLGGSFFPFFPVIF